MHGTGSYPPDWSEIAERIKRAARYRCEHCGHKHEPSAGYTLTVHHLDGDKSNCHWRNLVALCQRCHLHIQGTWRPGQLWMIDPPDWAVWRGHVPGHLMPEVTGVDQQLLKAIQSSAGDDGSAQSLFQVAVVEAGLDYAWALHRLNVLEVLGYVGVERRGAGRPLVMRVRS